ncbi:MAG: DUF4258 domain-containing protein [Blastocatellia bacterium]
MYDKILQQMRKAARADRVRITTHASDEMAKERLSADDVINGVLTGEVVKDQFDIKYQDTKYVIFGDALDGREIGVVAKIGASGNVIVITVYQLNITDYE